MQIKRLYAVLLLVILSTATTAFSQTVNHWPEFYDQAPVIKVIDPMAVLVGNIPEGENTLTIKLTDVALYSGHVCAGIASGYMITKKALDALYPNSTPERGQIRVAAMAPEDPFDVASYITGARSFYGRGEINANDLVIDPNIKSEQKGIFVMVFQRKDTGKAVKAVFNKFKLIPPQQKAGLESFLRRVLEGKASTEEKASKWAKIQSN